jgi:hypothetical protein
MRKRYQEGNVKKQRGVWIAQWWENGHRRSRALGSVWGMTKTEAKAGLWHPSTFESGQRRNDAHCRLRGTDLLTFLPTKVEALNGSEQPGED